MPAKKVTNKKAVKKTAKKVVQKAAKKVTKKKAVKKVAKKAVKKVAPKKVACKSCTATCDAPEAFWVHNGPILHSLKDLLNALEAMSDEQYEHHTTRDGNDFATWIQYCIKDSAVATNLRRAKTKSDAINVLAKKCCSK